MGWTSISSHYDPSKSAIDYAIEELEGGNWNTVIKRSGKYCAFRINQGHYEGQIAAAVLLTQSTKSDRSWKIVTSDMGPADDSCPDSILDLLTEPTNDYDREWRERCRANNELKRRQPKLKPGDTVELAKPIRFSDGVSTTTLKFIKGFRFHRDTDGRQVQMPRQWKTQFDWSVSSHG